MASKKDLLKEKLSALKPSVPTSTRDDSPREKAAAGQDPAAGKKQELAATAIPAKPPKAQPNVPPPSDPAFVFENAFLCLELMNRNAASLARMRDVIIEEMNNINRNHVSNCRQCLEAYNKTIMNTCAAFTSFKWPFKF